MAASTEALLEKSGQLWRQMAGHQGKAYAKYGEALEQYGKGAIGSTEIYKIASDLYIGEFTRAYSSYVNAYSKIFGWPLTDQVTVRRSSVADDITDPHLTTAVVKKKPVHQPATDPVKTQDTKISSEKTPSPR